MPKTKIIDIRLLKPGMLACSALDEFFLILENEMGHHRSQISFFDLKTKTWAKINYYSNSIKIVDMNYA